MKQTWIKLLALPVAVVLIASCKGKEKKPDELPPEQTAGTNQDTNIQSQPMDFAAQGSDSGQIAGLYTINFEFDKSTLDEKARSLAQKNADWLKANSKKSLEIEGHCDRHGSIEYNLALGERRARTVKQYMINLGVDGKRLSIVTYGKEKPLDTAETEAADAQNRRANFLVK
ncbi:MAG: OmpA family protein [Oligoflexia bacterium]|nr:OmpA family protein [Oligoflexia bacterium]